MITNALVIQATAQAAESAGIDLREVYCNGGMKVVYTFIENESQRVGWFFFARNTDYIDLVASIAATFGEFKVKQP